MNADAFPGLRADLLGGSDDAMVRIRWMIGVSLLVHVGVLALLTGVRWSKPERPLAAYDVSLVSLPTQDVAAPAAVTPVEDAKAPEPVPAPPTPLKHEVEVKETQPAPVHLPPPPQPKPLPKALSPPSPPMMKPKQDVVPPVPAVKAPPAAVPPAPAVRPREAPLPATPPAPAPSRPTLNRDVLKGFNLPEVPKLADVKPPPSGVPKDAKNHTEEEVQKLLKNLNVPEPVVDRPQPLDAAPARPPAPSVADELSRQLQTLQKQTALPPPPAPSPRAEPPQEKIATAKAPTGKAPTTATGKAPTTALQLPGLSQGNPYLALVQKRISHHWIAPKVVGEPDERLQVIVGFRLDRSGRITDIVIEQSSGNEYFDLAAKRAIVAASPLPGFPPDLTSSHLNAHFSFTVGEPVS